MNDRETARYDIFGRAETFGIINTADFTLGSITAKFIAHELPADFVQDLTDDRAAIDGAKDDVESDDNDDNDGVENTGAVGRLIKAGMKETTYLKAIMVNKYSRNGEKLIVWKSASTSPASPNGKNHK